MSKLTVREDVYYTTDHVWIRMNTPGHFLVGLTPFAVEALGEIVFVKLPEVGKSVLADAVVCEVEAAKAMTDVHSPISGTVSSVNSELVNNPKAVNQDPFANGWIFELQTETIDVDALDNVSDLLDHIKYRRLVEGD